MEKNPTKKQIAQILFRMISSTSINLELGHGEFPKKNTPSDTDSTFGISFQYVYFHICTSYIVCIKIYIYIDILRFFQGIFPQVF